MNNDIKGLGTPSTLNSDTRTKTNEQRSNATSQQVVKEQANDINRQAASVVRRDVVELSKGAQALKNISEKLQKQPEVNDKRVADIKAALASGNYKINDLVIADKLLQIDDLFE